MAVTSQPPPGTRRPPTGVTPTQRLRAGFLIGLMALALALVIYVIVGTGGPYTIHARFLDAGQLVKGNLVEVGGRPVGKVSDLRLTNDNQADVVMNISDGEFKPLHVGTIATIRQVGLAGIANRYVELMPGPSNAPKLKSGAVLTTASTRPIVDLDQLLDALDPKTRLRLQTIIRQGSAAFSGLAPAANRAFEYANPALDQTAALGDQLVRDRAALDRLVRTSGTVASAVASRETDLEQGIGNTRIALRAIGSQRAAIQDTLDRAPAVLTQSTGTLGRVQATLTNLRPTLLAAQPAAPPLARVLRELVPTARRLTPVITDVRAILPALRKALAGLPALARVAVPAVRGTTSTLAAALPIVTGLRPYAPDVVSGLFNSFGAYQAGYYDANGHYARIAFEGGSGGFFGLGSLLPPPSVPGLVSYSTGQTARCPGGAVEPAPDKSNPYIEDPSNCNPKDDHP